MKIRIATKAWQGTGAASTRHETEFGIGPMWVELDGHRTSDLVSAVVETSEHGVSVVTIKFLAAAEMVLVGPDGTIIPPPEQPAEG